MTSRRDLVALARPSSSPQTEAEAFAWAMIEHKLLFGRHLRLITGGSATRSAIAPSLDALVADPLSASHLSRDEALALLPRVAALQGALLALLLADLPSSPPIAGPEQAIRLKDAAPLLG